MKLAAEKQARIAGASQRIAGSLGISGIKYACDFNGYFGGRARLPILPVNAEEKNEIEGPAGRNPELEVWHIQLELRRFSEILPGFQLAYRCPITYILYTEPLEMSGRNLFCMINVPEIAGFSSLEI